MKTYLELYISTYLAAPENKQLLKKFNELQAQAKTDPEGIANDLQELEKQLQVVRKRKINSQKPIPNGGISVEERIAQGGQPPPKVKQNPSKYYYDLDSSQYRRRPEPKPSFENGLGQRPIPCFVEGTLVRTEQGEMPIELLKTGMRVPAFDEKRQIISIKPITALLYNQTVRLVEILTEKDTINATCQHRFWEEKYQRWIAARYLEPGMFLKTITGDVQRIKGIAMREVLPQNTFNITVADLHTYFVGKSGLLVHNEDEIPTGKIYVGRDGSGNIIYVGQTKQSLEDRASQHRRDAIKEPEKYGFKKDMKLEIVPGMDGLTGDEMAYHERRIYDELGGQEKLRNLIKPIGDEKVNALRQQYC